MKAIRGLKDFLVDLREAGMSMFGKKGEGIFKLCDYFGSEIAWQTTAAMWTGVPDYGRIRT